MTEWELKIIDGFKQRYAAAASRPRVDECKPLEIRLRAVKIFPEFFEASADDKDSFLEAAEVLEGNGIIKINWEKRGRGEVIKTITCKDAAKLFEITGGRNPETELERIKKIIDERRPDSAFLRFATENLNSCELCFRIDAKAISDFILLLESLDTRKNITTRALSVELYNDSKRLEYIIELFKPLANKARKRGVPVPDVSLYTRSFPEVMLAGRLTFEYQNAQPLVNSAGSIISFPLVTVKEFKSISTISGETRFSVLTIENKETFYALASAMRGRADAPYDCVIYSGGYPNEACAVLLRLFASRGCAFFHSGDLDPAGILILQHIGDIIRAGGAHDIAVSPLFMNAEVFERYLPYARTLSHAALNESAKIREDTRAITGIAALLKRIEETGAGVEQEVIDWDDSPHSP